ncbi:S-adenosyl-L-methionine-dependent methyltransferase [Mollisia scopiformis]|uniref:S-adenosyl-L-methionine-dependent methyltransferase n=1 Tax=Mollisia scopiformis TaxID=149040 RepID=A0A194XN49_MOLSC|nr:S-adenosyl-L-methionine-dependent methyltransferase [Mollisia scopiformis]KUJ21593.1 S-adenosyl-L-methionine-dependent methyltransferase [Mollisia scopiformis]
MADTNNLAELGGDHPSVHLSTAEPAPAVSSADAALMDPDAEDEELTSEEEEEEEAEEEHHDNDNDRDSAYGESLQASDMASITSEITKHRYENGRRYHAYRDGAYWAPNDEVHNEQQDMAHHLWLLTFDDKLYLSPIATPQNVLDIGTGTGIWAIDMADIFPAATIKGVDLSPIQPSWIPPNCIFEIDDVTLPWTFHEESYDLVHIREMFGSIGDWDELFLQAYQTLKPGGYLECAEHSVTPVSDDGTVGPDHVFTRYGVTMNELARRRGKEFDVWVTLEERMKKAGFVDVVAIRKKWPMNGWSSDQKEKELGRWNQLRVSQGIEGFAMRMLTTVGGWTPAQVQIFAAQIRAALRDRSVHGYLDVIVVYGRKPESYEKSY